MSRRSDIQGLRALAVMLVVVAHIFGVPFGGYVGVDVFYVISGFLITGILLKEIEKSGSISFTTFYVRRIRRLVPASVAVVLATLIAAFALWYLPRALQTALDGVSGVFFTANWHFQALGTDYLQATKPVSPLQHYWSLAVEEQFYVFWPAALLLLFRLFKGSRRSISVAVVVLFSASLTWSIWSCLDSPSAAYFDTFGRGWELLAGALISILTSKSSGGWLHLSRPVVRTSVSVFGLLLIVGSALFITDQWTAPYPAVIPSVLGTSLVLIAGGPAGPRTFLGNPLSQWLGKISYSLYLWHFPIIVFAESIVPQDAFSRLALIPLVVFVAALSHRVLEEPFQASGRHRSHQTRLTHNSFPAREALTATGAFALILVLSLIQIKGPGAAKDAGALAKFMGGAPVSVQEYPASVPARTASIQHSLATGSWTAPLRAQLDGLFPTQLAPDMLTQEPGCRNDVEQSSAMRVCGEVKPGSVLVLGDSVALSWAPTVREAFASAGKNVAVAGFASCPLVDVPVSNPSNPNFTTACGHRRQELVKFAIDSRPSVVVLSSAQSYLDAEHLNPQAWKEGLATVLDQLASVPAVVVLSNPPRTVFPDGCATRVTGPSTCTSALDGSYREKASAEREAVAGRTNAIFVDTESWFCSDGKCPLAIDGNVTRTDNTHLTDAGARAVGGLLREALGTARVIH